jgi:hypothetical protein
MSDAEPWQITDVPGRLRGTPPEPRGRVSKPRGQAPIPRGNPPERRGRKMGVLAALTGVLIHLAGPSAQSQEAPPLVLSGGGLARAAQSGLMPSKAPDSTSGFRPTEAGARLCRDAFARVEKIAGWPEHSLVGLAKVESGLWPWTLNVAGKPHRFATRDEAASVLTEVLKTSRSVAIGCGQIHARWHGDELGSPLLLLDPDLNAAFAAQFLGRLQQGTECRGSFSCAGKLYFRHPDLAERDYYDCRWGQAIAALRGLIQPDCQVRK